MISYRTLVETDFDEMFRTMDDAFSDYFVKIKMTPESYRHKLNLEGVKFDRSVGAFEGEKLVGITMNALGKWNGKRTVYDSGTGVVPKFRQRGIGRGMFEFILPILRRDGLEQYLLEVITENEPAFKLYKKLGFNVEREFEIYQLTKPLVESSRDEGEIRELDQVEWETIESFWTNKPSWQNSSDWIKRAEEIRILGFYRENNLIAYGAVSEESGKISQLAVAKEFRRRGIASVIVGELKKISKKPLIMTNIDIKAKDIISFLTAIGFDKTVSQYEMMLRI